MAVGAAAHRRLARGGDDVPLVFDFGSVAHIVLFVASHVLDTAGGRHLPQTMRWLDVGACPCPALFLSRRLHHDQLPLAQLGLHCLTEVPLRSNLLLILRKCYLFVILQVLWRAAPRQVVRSRPLLELFQAIWLCPWRRVPIIAPHRRAIAVIVERRRLGRAYRLLVEDLELVATPVSVNLAGQGKQLPQPLRLPNKDLLVLYFLALFPGTQILGITGEV